MRINQVSITIQRFGYQVAEDYPENFNKLRYMLIQTICIIKFIYCQKLYKGINLAL